MTPAAIARIRASYSAFAGRVDELVELFYSTLFARHPQVRPLFSADMTRQKEHLAASLAIIFRNIDCLDVLERPLMDLGALHATFGVRPDHYPMVRDAMLEAIGAVAAPAWSDQLEQDWREAVNRVAAIMLKGAAIAALDVATNMAPSQAQRPTGQRPPRQA